MNHIGTVLTSILYNNLLRTSESESLLTIVQEPSHIARKSVNLAHANVCYVTVYTYGDSIQLR